MGLVFDTNGDTNTESFDICQRIHCRTAFEYERWIDKFRTSKSSTEAANLDLCYILVLFLLRWLFFVCFCFVYSISFFGGGGVTNAEVDACHKCTIDIYKQITETKKPLSVFSFFLFVIFVCLLMFLFVFCL